MKIWYRSGEYCGRYRVDMILSTNGQTDVKPVYPFQLCWSWGIKHITFKSIFMVLGNCHWKYIEVILENHIHRKSTLDQVMATCLTEPSHYQIWCWPQTQGIGAIRQHAITQFNIDHRSKVQHGIIRTSLQFLWHVCSWSWYFYVV